MKRGLVTGESGCLDIATTESILALRQCSCAVAVL